MKEQIYVVDMIDKRPHNGMPQDEFEDAHVVQAKSHEEAVKKCIDKQFLDIESAMDWEFDVYALSKVVKTFSPFLELNLKESKNG